jgi:predicted TPR repeat methyltransferase
VIERLLAAEKALEAGQDEVAERLFAQVAAADPRNAIAVVGLARVASRHGDVDEATAHARRALEIDPEDDAARRLLEELTAPVPALTPSRDVAPRPGGRRGALLGWFRRALLGRD